MQLHLCDWENDYFIVTGWEQANLSFIAVIVVESAVKFRNTYKRGERVNAKTLSPRLHAESTIDLKKLLHSDWLRAVQFKCNDRTKSLTPVQIAHRNSGLWFTRADDANEFQIELETVYLQLFFGIPLRDFHVTSKFSKI